MYYYIVYVSIQMLYQIIQKLIVQKTFEQYVTKERLQQGRVIQF